MEMTGVEPVSKTLKSAIMRGVLSVVLHLVLHMY